MKKLIPCMLAGLIITGLFALCITSFLAPSANYIQDTLEPTEEPFYFVLNPSNYYGYIGDDICLSALTNVSDCNYSWEFINYTSSGTFDWSPTNIGYSFNGGFFRSLNISRPEILLFYRCVASWHGRTIYSAPCMVYAVSSQNKNQDSKLFDKNSDFEEDLNDFEKTEAFYESEVIG